ncbi:MAG: FprA family A-type flavoprotein [Gammaproteobacteria bacterium]
MSNLQAIKITDRVYWVGAIDWALRDFHGYHTSKGSTYNAYLILGEEPILVDTVKGPFVSEMIERIKSVIPLEKIQYIISNHAEMDHSSGLPEMIQLASPKKIFTSQAGVQALRDHFHQLPDILCKVANGETLTLGNTNLKFIATKMLHWPESMFTYFADEGVLFSQDAFGMHLATQEIFAEHNDPATLYREAGTYFANILLPYSPLVLQLFKNIEALNLSIQLVAPVHGPIWRKTEDIQKIFSWWKKWAEQKIYPKVVIAYDTMWQSTAKMAIAIADGVIQEPGITPLVMPLSSNERSSVAFELLEAGALLLGSPTLNQQTLPSIADLICYLKGLKRKNLFGQCFGSYGWGAESITILKEEMQKMFITLIDDPIKARYVPTSDVLSTCSILGKKIAKLIKTKI